MIASDPAGPTLAVGDVNGDGLLDLVVTGTSAAPADRRLAVLLGDGHGGFSAARVMELPMFVLGQALGDVDGDGVLDVVLAGATDYSGTSMLQVLHGRGDGSFVLGPSVRAGPWLASAPQHLVALADLDGDGILDIVTPGPQPPDMGSPAAGPSPTLEVRRGTHDGTFGSAETYPLDAHASAVAVADVDLDGHPDVVAVGWIPGRVASVLFNHGDGRLGSPTYLPG
ncbi:MAG TPA: VCBS repeat-containing protein, partial [Myxococcaceae bacterium]|nr:VCBS repeat-containing protein [Myxococcaceae bacterium]